MSKHTSRSQRTHTVYISEGESSQIRRTVNDSNLLNNKNLHRLVTFIHEVITLNHATFVAL